jgi:hypothetical protein
LNEEVSLIVEVLPESLNDVAQHAIGVSRPKGVRPVYSYVRVAAADGHVVVSAVNEEVAFEGRADASDIGAPGSAVVDAKRLGAVLKCLVNGDPAHLELKEGFLHVKQHTFRAKLPHYGAEAFPELELPSAPNAELAIDAQTAHGIHRVVACTEKERNGPYVGVLFDFEQPGLMRICGIGQFAVHFYQVPLDAGSVSGKRFALSRAVTSFPDTGDPLTLVIDEKGAAIFESPRFRLRVPFVADTFPAKYVELLGVDELAAGRFWARESRMDAKNPSAPAPGAERQPRWWAQYDRVDFADAFSACCSVLDDTEALVNLDLCEYSQDDQGVIGRTVLEGQNPRTQAKATKAVVGRAQGNQSSIKLRMHRDPTLASLRLVEANAVRFWFHDQALVLITEMHEDPSDHHFVVALRPGR